MTADAADNPPENADPVFPVHRVRKSALPVANVWHQDMPEGRPAGVTCSTCQLCLPE